MSVCGQVAIIGRPNVGKSTLLNMLLGKKISITSHKAQTTQDRVLGIKSTTDTQIIYIDTPGISLNSQHKINRSPHTSLYDIEVICLVIEALRWTAQDQAILDKLTLSSCPAILLVINKVDKIHKPLLLPFISKLSAKYPFKACIPISAKHGIQLAALEKAISQYLPTSDFLFPSDQITTASNSYLVAELIREQLMRYLHQEIPYSLNVEVETLNIPPAPAHCQIQATIWAESQSQKGIIIGKQGKQLKRIGTHARLSIEKLFKQRAYLTLWVKISSQSSDKHPSNS